MNQQRGLHALLILLRLLLFFLGCIKDNVFHAQVSDIEKLKGRLKGAVCSVTEQIQGTTRWELDILGGTTVELTGVKYTAVFWIKTNTFN